MSRTAEVPGCIAVDPVWDRRCVKDDGHEGPHQNVGALGLAVLPAC